MTRILILLAALGCINGVLAADPWDVVVNLPPGTRLRVRSFDKVVHRGELRSADSGFVRLNDGGQEVVASRPDVARVEVYTPSRRLRNALIGGSVGAAVGIAAGLLTCPSCAGELPAREFHKRLLYGGFAGAGAGAGLSLLGAPYKTVYKGRRGRR